jgi:hypothetical protein
MWKSDWIIIPTIGENKKCSKPPTSIWLMIFLMAKLVHTRITRLTMLHGRFMCSLWLCDEGMIANKSNAKLWYWTQPLWLYGFFYPCGQFDQQTWSFKHQEGWFFTTKTWSFMHEPDGDVVLVMSFKWSELLFNHGSCFYTTKVLSVGNTVW